MKHNITVLSLAFFGTFAAYPQVTLNTTPSRSVGAPIPNSNTVEGSNPNLVEGKELFSPYGLALDTSVTPPILYVADTGNNRVLGWKNATSFNNGAPADLVIGQQDFFATDPQGPGQKFSAGFSSPTSLAVTSNGDLYIADTNNNRVLRYRTPFQHVTSTPAALTAAPDLFIGQPSLNSRALNYTGQVSAQGLAIASSPLVPSNLAIDSSGNLWICDVGNYRVLGFRASDLNTTGGSISAYYRDRPTQHDQQHRPGCHCQQPTEPESVRCLGRDWLRSTGAALRRGYRPFPDSGICQSHGCDQ